MLAHARTRAAAVARQTTLPKDRWARLAAVAALVLLIAACTPVPSWPMGVEIVAAVWSISCWRA